MTMMEPGTPRNHAIAYFMIVTSVGLVKQAMQSACQLGMLECGLGTKRIKERAMSLRKLLPIVCLLALSVTEGRGELAFSGTAPAASGPAPKLVLQSLQHRLVGAVAFSPDGGV